MTTIPGVAVDKEQTASAKTSPPSAPSTTTPAPVPNSEPEDIKYIQYSPDLELQYLTPIRALISQDLSEPYSIYVYRYFLYQWGDLCFMAIDPTSSNALVGVVVCKLEPHRGGPVRGYIAMLATRQARRGRGVATRLVRMAIEAMRERGADEVALETEQTNAASLRLYERLGFLRSKKLHRYYLNGNAAYRLNLYLKPGTAAKPTAAPDHPPFPRPGDDGAYDQDYL